MKRLIEKIRSKLIKWLGGYVEVKVPKIETCVMRPVTFCIEKVAPKCYEDVVFEQIGRDIGKYIIDNKLCNIQTYYNPICDETTCRAIVRVYTGNDVGGVVFNND